MKALIYASVASMVEQFNMENINILLGKGYQVEVACNFEDGNTISEDRLIKFKHELQSMGIKYTQIPIPRSIFSIVDIIKSFILTKKLFSNTYYDIIHFHSPIGAAIGRVASIRTRNQGSKTIYTAHGFHFFKGSSFFSWITYFPMEYILSIFTDTIITINSEDFSRAKNFPVKNVVYIPGVGIDTDNMIINEKNIENKRKEMKILKDEIVFLSVGELNENKNHKQVIKALSTLKIPFKYFICGQGNELPKLKSIVKELGIEENVYFLGYRTDIKQLLNIADIYCFPSKREGLSVALMEAMAAGLPCLVSKIRGNIDLIDENGGYLFDLDNNNELVAGMNELVKSKHLRESMGKYNIKKIKQFDIHRVNEIMAQVYE